MSAGYITPQGVSGRFQPDLIPSLVPIAALEEDPDNVRLHPEENLTALRVSLDTFGQTKPVVCRIEGDRRIVVAGNGTLRAASDLGWSHIAVVRFAGSPHMAKGYAIADNRIPELAAWDSVALDAQLVELSQEWPAEGLEWKADTLGLDAEAVTEIRERSPRAEKERSSAPSEPSAPLPPEPAAPATIEISGRVALGDIWALGPHCVLCGDSTDPDVIGRLMSGQRAVLLHADPPYGMNQEIENDHLHSESLDRFLLNFWNACRPHLTDNASAYIWGTAPDLWRFWYRSLERTEILTLKNEIVWSKGSAPGMASPEMRSYALATERALFFLLGQEEIGNVNADAYWEGWEPLRAALGEELRLTPWDAKEVADIAGTTPRMVSHWFGKSQWAFLPRDRYERLKAAGCEYDAFQHDYDAIAAVHAYLSLRYEEVKKGFYSGRAFFDGAHDAMTDVWEYPRVVGAERWEHATPKPVRMIARALRSSAPEGAIVLEPFLGSGSTLIAAEQTGRICYGCEITPAYAETTIVRWEALTGRTATKVLP